MISFVCTPKPFVGQFSVIQTNAISSWCSLDADVEILLFGKCESCAEIASQVQVRHIPDVRCNKHGTPYLSDIFTKAKQLAQYPILCYVNADIILPRNFLANVSEVESRFQNFLMLGSRWDLDWELLIDFADEDAVDEFFTLAKHKSERHKPSGIDYFVFTKATWKLVPDLLVGRAGFDNWLIWRARRSRIPVIDASLQVLAVHQNHDYSHHPDGRSGVFEGEEAQNNRQYLFKNGTNRTLNILDATYVFTSNGIKKKEDHEWQNRYYSRLDVVYPEFRYPIQLFRKLRGRYLYWSKHRS